MRARFVGNVNGIRMHVLDAGFAASSGSISPRPAILLVHGFPELAYSWRKIMLPLAAARASTSSLRTCAATDAAAAPG